MVKVCRVLVEKRTYHPAGWMTLREVEFPCRVTAKRVYTEGKVLRHIFDLASKREVQPILHRINESIRYTLIEVCDAR